MNGITKLALRAPRDVRNAVRDNTMLNFMGKSQQYTQGTNAVRKQLRRPYKAMVRMHLNNPIPANIDVAGMQKYIRNNKKFSGGYIDPGASAGASWLSRNKGKLGVGAAGVAGVGGLGLLLSHLKKRRMQSEDGK